MVDSTQGQRGLLVPDATSRRCCRCWNLPSSSLGHLPGCRPGAAWPLPGVRCQHAEPRDAAAGASVSLGHGVCQDGAPREPGWTGWARTCVARMDGHLAPTCPWQMGHPQDPQQQVRHPGQTDRRDPDTHYRQTHGTPTPRTDTWHPPACGAHGTPPGPTEASQTDTLYSQPARTLIPRTDRHLAPTCPGQTDRHPQDPQRPVIWTSRTDRQPGP